MFGLRESNWILRLLTGAIFGFGIMWFALPMLHRSVTEVHPSYPPQMMYRTPQNSQGAWTPMASPHTYPSSPESVDASDTAQNTPEMGQSGEESGKE